MRIRVIKYPESNWNVIPTSGEHLGIGYEHILLMFNFWKWTIRLEKSSGEK